MPERRFNLSLAAIRHLAQRWGPPKDPLLRLQMATSGAVLSAAEWVQRAAWAARLEAITVEKPIFIVGHWRSGTTLLHELLCTAPGLSYPTTHACLCPQYFLLDKEGGRKRHGAGVTRPMDNMVIEADSPQEDEFALLCLGLPSPYEAFLHPKALPQVLALADLDPASSAAWAARFKLFLAGVSALTPGKRLVLKSPPHSLRIAALAALFPDAQFIHIIRDPRRVYPSAIRMWREMFRLYAVGEMIDADVIGRSVVETISGIDAAITDAAVSLPPGRYTALRYEDLVGSPSRVIGDLHEFLGLGDREEARSRLAAAWEQRQSYRPAALADDPAAIALVEARCGHLIEKYGYRRGPA
jgi:hypothetical protein